MTSYGFTPNTAIPLNNREPGEIAGIAWDQLMPYQIAAETWPVHAILEDGRAKNVCRVCNQNIWFTTDPNNAPYNYELSEQLALIVAHVRQVHATMVNAKGEFHYEATGESEILDNPLGYYLGNISRCDANRPEHQGSDSRGIEYT